MSASPSAGFSVDSNKIFAQNVNITNDVRQTQTTSSRRDPIELLHENVAFSALYNSRERFDPPKCHPQTRTAVLDRIERWAADDSDAAKQILWLSGPAGAGKSAIAQTLVESWKAKGVIVLAFFFWRTSLERNQSSHLVPTIASELLELFPATKAKIEAAVNTGAVFKKNLGFQLDKLVIEHLGSIPHGNHPVLIVIDGLDECCIDLPGQGYESQQREILEALGSACHKTPLLRFLIVSRPERQIRASFATGFIEKLTQPLLLNDAEDASADIQLFLECNFQEIRKQHGIECSWPTEAQISELIRKSSGQFIYPSIAVKHISRARANPKQSLNAVLKLQPGSANNPLAELDMLYTLVLKSVSAESLPIVTDVLGYMLPYHKGHHTVEDIFTPKLLDKSCLMFDRFLFLPDGDVNTHLADLHSVMSIPPPHAKEEINFIHATFSEYLQNKFRSGDFFISKEQFITRYTQLLLQHLQAWDLHPAGHVYDTKLLTLTTTNWITDYPRQTSLAVYTWSLMKMELGSYPLAMGHVDSTFLPLSSKQLSTMFVSVLRNTVDSRRWMRNVLKYLEECNIPELEPSWWRRYLVRRRLKAAFLKYSFHN